MKIEDYATVHELLFDENGKLRHAEKTRKIYCGYLLGICECLNKNPDEIIHEIKKAENQAEVIRENHRKLASDMANRGLMLRSADLRLLTLVRFYRCNGIKVSAEFAKELKKRITARAFKDDFKDAVSV